MQPGKRVIITTEDGSPTVSVPEWNVTYHSRHGAVQESRHVYIEAGLHYVMRQQVQAPLQIFEMGFGTGLNAILTALEAEKHKLKMHYTTVELYPLLSNEVETFHFNILPPFEQQLFQQLHKTAWNQTIAITPFFAIEKLQTDLLQFSAIQRYHLVFYDAFDPAAQPELWSVQIFQKLYNLLKPGGVVVTYSAKGDVQRAMKTAGLL